ncbi:tyrosine-type recombinase/integrase [Planctomicrobium sp. SH668]|uniref:tyrosine-type recombinase/integrase n=1 Tax=Planctomicrobium sp. SH668 TaxID=3448126 RepID=UPI003F5ADE4F
MPKCLTDATVRNAKPKSTPYKMSDGEGLFLLITPTGSKYWRLRYFFGGKEKLLALGVYPQVSLIEAREKRMHAQKQLAVGTDPGEAKKEEKKQEVFQRSNPFEKIADEWFRQHEPEWATSYSDRLRRQIDRHLLPKLGKRPIAEINASDVLTVLRAIEAKGTLETAHRMKQVVGQIFMYGIATQRADRNPVPDLQGALKTPVVKHQPSLKEDDLPEFLGKLEAYEGGLVTKQALHLLLLTFVRTTELRGAQWGEFNWDKAEWRIPPDRMKMKELHIVPLSRQAIGILQELHPITGHGHYVFPNEHNLSSFMSENTMLYALYRMGYHGRATGHGFRSTASTILNEHGFRPDVIERQLAHGERDKVRAAYNHAQYLPERREMMQWWADFLDQMAAKKPSK